MIRFEIPPKTYSRNIKIWRWVGFISGIALLTLAFFLYAWSNVRRYISILYGVDLVLTFSPIQPKKMLRFIEISDKKIKWNNTEEYNNKLLSNGPEELDWLEITRIKKIQHNELMIFVENSFYRRIWLNDYTPDQQQKIIDTIKVYGERFSLHWVEEQKEAAIA
jgi:hypothetical protein